jgi:hypothetical protein
MDAFAAAAGSADSFAEEGANSASSGFLSRLAVRWGVPPSVIPIIMMSFGCFLDGISDITFLASMVSATIWHVQSSSRDRNPDYSDPWKVVLAKDLSDVGGYIGDGKGLDQVMHWIWCDDTVDGTDTCDNIIAAGKYFKYSTFSGDSPFSKIHVISLVLLSVVCVKESMKLVPFFHIYVSPHFHSPKNFQALHNSSVTWIVLLFSKRWQNIAKDSLVFEKEAPAIIHILADVVIEDVPQLAFTLFLLVIGLRFPCFLANADQADWVHLQDCSEEPPLALDDGTVCYVAENSPANTEASPGSSYFQKLVYFHDNGDIEGAVCKWKSTDSSGCEAAFGWDERWQLLPRTDITYMNQCSSSFSSQSIIPFCSCSGFGGGGIDGLMVFSLLMTIISTGSKIWKLKTNIQKRHQNIEEAYRNKTARGESGGISSLELNEIGDTSERIKNPAIQPSGAVSGAALDMRRLEKLESMLVSVQKKADATDQELEDIKKRLTKVEGK